MNTRFTFPVTPAAVTPALQALIDELCNGAKPILVDVHPEVGASDESCFPTVLARVAKDGGRAVIGWRLGELPGVFLEAEFHCVWERPDGKLVDITPKSVPTAKVLFLADPSRSYEGRQVNNVRRVLVVDPVVAQFIALRDTEFEFLNRGARALQHEVKLTDLTDDEVAEYRSIKMQQQMVDMQFAQRLPLIDPYHPCTCGSGLKIKFCHRDLLPPRR